MAKRKSGVNRSKEIRDILAVDPKTPVKVIIETLGARGIKVGPPLVYFVKNKLKKQKRRQARQKVAGMMGDRGPMDAITVIRNVKELAANVGGLTKLKQLVEALGE